MKTIVVAVLSISAITAPAFCKDAQRPTSDLAVPTVQRMVRALESAPLGKEADDLRAVLFNYFDDMRPQIVLCLDQFQPLISSKKKAHKSLWIQIAISSGSYLLDHPEAIENEIAYQTAGLEGMLRAYEKMIEAKPKLRHEFPEKLLQLRDSGVLFEFARENACNADSSFNNRLNLTVHSAMALVCARPTPEWPAG